MTFPASFSSAWQEICSQPVHPSLSCRTSPPQAGRFSSGAVFALPSNIARNDETVKLAISLLEGEMPGRTERGAAVASRVAAVSCATFSAAELLRKTSDITPQVADARGAEQ